MSSEDNRKPSYQEKRKQDKLLTAKKQGLIKEEVQDVQEDYEKLVESRRLREIQIMKDLSEIKEQLTEKQPIQLISQLNQLMQIQYFKIEKEQEKYQLVEQCYLLIISNYLMIEPKINECNNFISTIFRDYNTGCPQLCKKLLTTLFNNILDLQTKITPNINKFPNISDFLSRQLEYHSLNQDEKYLALIISVCNSILNQLTFNLAYIQLIRELLVKLIRTTSYFDRVKETTQLIKYIDKLVISEDMSEQDKIDCQTCISELRVDIVPCILNLPIYDIIFDTIYKAVEYLPKDRYFDHMNNVIKFLSIEEEWVSMCYALRVFIQLFGYNESNKNYAIEAFILAHTQEGGKSKITITDEIRYICLEQQLDQWLDSTCSNKENDTIIEETIEYLLSYCTFEQEFINYCKQCLSINCENYKDFELKQYLENSIQTLHTLAKKYRVYAMYADQQINQIISNATFYQITKDNKKDINVKQLYDQICDIVKNINQDYCNILYHQFKFIIIQLIKLYNTNLHLNCAKNTISGEEIKQKEISQEIKSFLQLNLSVSLQKEKIQFLPLKVKIDNIEQRLQEIKDRTRKINEENERKEQERQNQLKLYQEQSQKILKEKLKKQREQEITINQCQLFIREASMVSSNPDIQNLLQTKLNQMIANEQIPFITYVNELSVYYNDISKQEILQRQEQSEKQEKDQLYQEFVKHHITKEQLIKNALEAQETENQIISQCAEARYQYDMEQYKENNEFIQTINNIANLEKVRDDCDHIVNAKYYEQLDQYEKMLQDKINEIRQQNEKDIEEWTQKKKEADEQVKNKQQHGKSRLEQLRALRAKKQQMQNQ